MKAAIFHGPGRIVVQERPRPAITHPTDAVVRVVLACVCGSDLWFYRGISDLPHGGVGHEFIGVVDEIGADVHDVAVGQLVISPFSWSDGTCRNCRHGVHTACIEGGFFGQGGDGDGGQAEYVRVPHADGTLVPVPPAMSAQDGGDPQGYEGYDDATLASLLALTDVMATGHHAAVSAGVTPGQTVAVVGDGAVGLCGVLAARLLGAARVIVLGSTHEDRHALAREWGATDLITSRGRRAVDELMTLTDGYGADAVLECVGTDESSATAFAVAAPGAVVGRVGVPHDVTVDGEATFYRNVGMRGGPAPARAYQPHLLRLVLDGTIDPGKVFDATYPLDDIAEAYAAMDERRVIKALVTVGPVSPPR